MPIPVPEVRELSGADAQAVLAMFSRIEGACEVRELFFGDPALAAFDSEGEGATCGVDGRAFGSAYGSSYGSAAVQ